jgi:Holliday junction resolvase
LTIKQRDQTIYREREQAGKIVDFLGKIRRALRWFNKSLSETENEVKFLELWIPFELLGGGSYHYKDNIPKILAEKYISRRWSSLTIKQRYQTIYQEREQAGKIVDFLAETRSSLLIHRGEIDLPQLNYSVEQLHSIMRFLINEIFVYLNYKFNKKETISDLTKEMIGEIDRVRGLRG